MGEQLLTNDIAIGQLGKFLHRESFDKLNSASTSIHSSTLQFTTWTVGFELIDAEPTRLPVHFIEHPAVGHLVLAAPITVHFRLCQYGRRE